MILLKGVLILGGAPNKAETRVSGSSTPDVSRKELKVSVEDLNWQGFRTCGQDQTSLYKQRMKQFVVQCLNKP